MNKETDDTQNNSIQEQMEQHDEAQLSRTLSPVVLKIFLFTSLALGIFHLYTSFAGPLVDFLQRDIHLFVLLGLAFLLYPAIKKHPELKRTDILLTFFTISIGVYLFLSYERIVENGGVISVLDLVVGAFVILLVLEATRRVVGWGLPLLAIVFLFYGVYTKLSFYPVLNGKIVLVAIKSLVSHLVFITEGVFSTAIGVSASYIVLFVLFGAFLLKTGLGEFFHDTALAIGGSKDGGPAKVATIASGMLGSINGAAVANVVTTGTFTIPLMKKVGYNKNFAGAVEASASVGGQILPPIMGAAAFIMAENLGIPYVQIILAGIIPAVLYYFGILTQVHLRAKKMGLKGLSKDSLPKLSDIMRARGYVLFPVVVLVYLLFTGKTVIFSASWSIMSVMLISATSTLLYILLPLSLFIAFRHMIFILLNQGNLLFSVSDLQLLVIIGIALILNIIFSSRRSLSIKIVAEAMHDGIRSTIPVALACACVGIVVGITTITGVAIDVAHFVVTIGKNIDVPFIQLIITLILTMIASILLGMGLPSIPTYIITSTMAAPILLGIGIFRDIAGSPETAVFIAHMFVFYFGIFANITPPVALASYAATGISGGNPTTTGFYALKLSLAGFIVPFVFVFSPEILMINPDYTIILTIITAMMGIYFLSIAVEGYWSFIKNQTVPTVLRVIFGLSSLLLVYPGLKSDVIGIVFAGLSGLFLFYGINKKETHMEP